MSGAERWTIPVPSDVLADNWVVQKASQQGNRAWVLGKDAGAGCLALEEMAPAKA